MTTAGAIAIYLKGNSRQKPPSQIRDLVSRSILVSIFLASMEAKPEICIDRFWDIEQNLPDIDELVNHNEPTEPQNKTQAEVQ